MSDIKTLVNELRNLGVVRSEWSISADTYFSHHSGKVSLGAARDFFDMATELSHDAADELEAHQAVVETARIVLNNPGRNVALLALRKAFEEYDAPSEGKDK